MSESIRLDKHLAGLLGCSRGEARKYIEGGWVLVDGAVVERPAFNVSAHKVTLHADASLEPLEPVTFLLHYPTGYDPTVPMAPLDLITAESRAEDDRYGIMMRKRHFSKLKPTADLESGATGLLVFSNDAQVIRRLVDDANKNEQEYIVEVDREIDEEMIKKLSQPMKLNHWLLPDSKVSMQSETRLRFALKYVRPGQIEHMCESVGLHLVSMRRIRIGRLPMGKLLPGEWRYMPKGSAF